MKISIPVKNDSFNTYAEELDIELVFNNSTKNNMIEIHIEGGAGRDKTRYIKVDKEDLKKLLWVLGD